MKTRVAYQFSSVELEMGLEPTTYGLQDRCATDCATPAHAENENWHEVNSTKTLPVIQCGGQ